MAQYYTSFCVINCPLLAHPFSREAAPDAWRTPYCVSLHPRPDFSCAVLCCGGRCASHRLIRPATLHLESQVGLTTTPHTLSTLGLKLNPSSTFSLTSNIASISTWPSRETPPALPFRRAGQDGVCHGWQQAQLRHHGRRRRMGRRPAATRLEEAEPFLESYRQRI